MLRVKERYATHAIIVYSLGFAARVASIFEDGFVEKGTGANANGNDTMMHLNDDFLRGSFTPLVTPFKDGAVDLDCYERLVDRHIEAGGHGIVVNGTSAEPSTLTIDERNALVARALGVAAGRTSVVAATGSQSLKETQALTEFASEAGAEALLVVTPYYIRPPQRGLIAYYLEVAKATDLPFMIY